MVKMKHPEDGKKPLHLHVYTQKITDAHPYIWYVRDDKTIRCSIRYATNLSKTKRFSASELAAEFWRANNSSRIRAYQRYENGDIVDVRGVGWEYEHDVMQRFAELPHYDEEN